MKITKLEHSCLVLEQEGEKLIIDPGVYSSSLTDVSNVSGVVVTHVHPDHFDPEKVKRILEANPSAIVYTVAAVAEELSGHPHKAVKQGDREQCGLFFLAFFGGEHAKIHDSYPDQQNIGVYVNNSFYHGGDSFLQPQVPVDVLSLPVSAPWLKISDALDYLEAVKPKIAFPSHNAILSDEGNEIYNRIIGTFAKEQGIDFQVLEPGSSMDLKA